MKYIFEKGGVKEFIDRIKKLNAGTPALWGKMNAAQMLAHCSYAYEDNAPMPNFFTRILIKFLVKGTVVGNKPYKKNMPTSSAFIITEERDLTSKASHGPGDTLFAAGRGGWGRA